MKKQIAMACAAVLLVAACGLTACGGAKDQTLKLEDGSTFVGKVSNGKPNGYGKLTDADGNEWEGNFTDGLLQGYAAYKGFDFVEYTGEFVDGKFHGLGKIVYANGDEYRGTFEEGEKIGVGEMIFSDSGCVYQGGWEKDQMHGFGWMSWTMGDIYWGNWRNGLPQGFGCKVFFDSNFSVKGDYLTYNMYTGRLSGNMMDGWGMMYSAESGGVYVGNWQNGVRKDDNGTYYFENGAEWLKFVGAFSAEENAGGWIYGEGTMYYADGRAVHGIFHGTDLVEEISVTQGEAEKTDPLSVILADEMLSSGLAKLNKKQ